MLFQFAKFELNYFRKQPSFYVTLLIFFLLPFFAMISENVQIGGAVGNVNYNSPYAITQTLLVMSIVGMFLVANFVGGTAVRDINSKMDGIVLSMPIHSRSYLWGRLLGALLFSLLVFFAVPLGTLLGTYWPLVDPARLGPTSLWSYFNAYLIFVIPNFIFCSVLFYVFALKTRSMMGMYLGVIAFFILYEVSSQLLSDPNLLQYAIMLDPFGIGAFSEATRYWTPYERNTLTLTLDNSILLNRVLWLSISAVIFLLAHWFIDVRKPIQRKKEKKVFETKEKPVLLLLTKPSFDRRFYRKSFFERTVFELGQTIKSAPFIILCLFAIFSLSSIFFGTAGAYGTSDWPLTRNMANYILGSFLLMNLIIITYYSAEMVWRERQLGIGDIVEATPIKNWTLYFPKLIALTAISTTLVLVGIVFTAIFQVTKTYTNFEWSVYFSILSIQFLIPTIMSTILAVFIQVLSPNKYLGMLIFVVYFIAAIVMSNLGLEHNMWQFRRIPQITYSDINGFGHYLEATLWYTLYWLGLCMLFVAIGYGMWRRGTEYALKDRFRLLGTNLGFHGKTIAGLGVVMFVSVGSYIYYNTRILNDFISSEQSLDNRAAYEKKYKTFAAMPLPTITDVNVNVDFYPLERKVVATGRYFLMNKNKQALDKVLLTWDGGKHRHLNYTMHGATIIEEDKKFYNAWLQFNKPLGPGETTRLDFTFTRENKGFVDRNSDTRVVANGSFLNSFELLPQFGYNKNAEIVDLNERRKRDLPPPERLAKLEDQSKYGTNFISQDADFINFETVVSTSEDQVAISPGYLQKEWIADGRRYFHYKMDAPIFNFTAFLSGKYAIKRDQHEGIAIEVYHHPDHTMNVDRMIESVKASLDYFGQAFSPYQHRQVRIIEFPRYARFAQSFSNTIPYSEDIGFIADLRDESSLDYVYFVTAHEMAHQWWGHQVMAADVQGSAVLSETLSEYSAYMVLEKAFGKHHMRKFLKYEMDSYLRGRTSELVEEMPLYRAENQSYIHYRKGGVVMYALRDRLGEKAVNTALRKFLQKFQYQSDPYPTTLDLLAFIRAEAPAEEHAFIDELFKKITLFDLRVKTAEAKQLDNGQYELTLTIAAEKYYADGKGEETIAELANNFDIGIFASDPDDPTSKDHVLHFEKHKIVSGENTIKLVLDEKPKYAGVDPYIKMIDRNSDDNLKAVTIN